MVTREISLPDGRRLSWAEAGPPDAPATIVWLHAFPLTHAMWQPQLAAVPPGWRAMAPDLAGLGASADHAGRPAIDDFVRDVEALLEAMGAGRVVVGGLSMGGYAALAYQRVAPGRLSGLVLADTRSGADSPEGRHGRERMLGLVESGGAPAVASEMLPKLVGSTTHARRPHVVAEVRRLIESNPVEGIRRAIMRMRDRPDSTGLLRQIRVPVLVVVGEEDAITPVEESRALASALDDGTLAIVPAAGHLSNMENPDSFNAALWPWLGGL